MVAGDARSAAPLGLVAPPAENLGHLAITICNMKGCGFFVDVFAHGLQILMKQ